ncbi:MAG TPA: peptide transporter, partial [Sumerlaeia bacterium]|nr:peptide transporter [Sumerlaeia bacterium]
MARSERIDKELDLFRNQMLVPSTFEDGFSWTALAGALFVALVMVPGSIYMGLLAGHSVGPAAQWVTVILFLEVARRAHRHIKRSEMFVLFFMAGTAMGVPFQGLLWNQFFLRSDAAAAFGVAAGLPSWFAPAADSSSYEARSFFQPDWLPVIGLVVFGTFFGQLSNLILGYGLFRLTSDVEELPFPMAPVGAQGIMALAEDVDEKELRSKEDSWRWRVFSIGGALGLAFGSVYLLLPTLSGAVTGKAIQILPIPFSDFTGKTQTYLPAVATGLAWDMGFLINGMVLPFFGMLGSFIGLLVTILANPLLYDVGILHNWQPGDDTIATAFKNNIDFYFSFQIGVALAIALFGIHQVVRAVRKKRDAGKMMTRKAAVPPGRGDVSPWIIFLCYFVVTMAYILVSGWLIDWHPGIMIVLVVLGFFYTPLVSYVTARLEGMV